MHVAPEWKGHKVRIHVDSSGAFSKDQIIFYSDPEGSVGTPQGSARTNGQNLLNLYFSSEEIRREPLMHSLVLKGNVFVGLAGDKANIQMHPIGAWKLRGDYTFEEVHDARTVCMLMLGWTVLP